MSTRLRGPRNIGGGLLIAVVCAGQSPAQASVSPRDHYALVNARIVVAPGQVIPSGAVLVREGRIMAVGSSVAIPATAARIDLAGLTVYPGLIDVATRLGLAVSSATAGAPAQVPRQDVAPERNAFELYAPTDEALRGVRDAGFTTVGLTFDRGIFPGRVAAVNTGDAKRVALRAPVAQQTMLGLRRAGVYPVTLMGSIAFVKQSFLDAQYATRMQKAWDAAPTSVRPDFSAVARGLQPAATGALPVWFTASTQRELTRIVDLAKEIGVQDYVVLGAQEGWLALEALKRAGKPVIIGLDFPAASAITGRAFELRVAAASGRDTSRRAADAMVQRATRGNAAALARAGIAFALSGNGLAPSVVHERVRQAIDAGLSADDALRALTITPARLLGVESAVGTIETGKIANLVVTRGDLFADNGRIVHVFVDGVRYEVAATVPVGRQAAPRAEEGDRNADVEGLLRGAVPAAKDFAIRNATILTVTKGTIRNGTVVIRGGVITAVGARVPIPSDVQVIDGTGKYVMPGIIDAHSHMAVDGGNNESSESVVPEVVIPVRNDDPTIFRALAGGVTSALILHGSSDAIGGQGSVIKLRWGQPAESLYFRGANRIVKFALGENPTRASADLPDSVRRFPKSRMGVEQTLRESFLRARKYEAEWKAYRQAVKSNDAAAIEPRRDLRLEALADILRGDLKVHAHSYRGDEILMLMRVAEEFGFRIDTFQHALEAYKVADEIAKHGASVSTFAELWGYKIEAMDAIPYNMSILHSRGVMVSVNSDENERVRRLYQEAPIGMKYGNMSETEALEMITINPARQLGVADKVGSIEVGKQADLAIFNAHPFAPEAKVEKTLIDGRIYFDVEKVPTFLKLIQQTPASPARNDP